MNSQNQGPGSDPAGPARHSLGREVADPEVERAESAGSPGAWFTVVLRGYDRGQVDSRLAELHESVREQARRADRAEAALKARANSMETAAGEARDPAEERGFGVRVERVLQAAEDEAADLRRKAATEATELLDRARTDAERQRRQTEQALLGRAATLDREFTSRGDALDTRERQVEEMLESARREADAIRGEAEVAAAHERAEAERRAAELVREAEIEAQDQRSGAARDVGRLSSLRDEVRDELRRVEGLLRDELGREPVDSTVDDALFGRTGPEAEPAAEGGDPRSTDPAGPDADDALTGRLRIASSRDVPEDDENPNERTSIGTIPPFTASSIGVLPFRDRGGSPSKVRPFAFGPETPDGGAGGESHGGSSTSDDDQSGGGSPNGTPTRSSSSPRGPR